MMIAELIDQDDYVAFLKGSGVPLQQDWTPQQCSQAALAWLVEQNEVVRTQFAMSVSELQEMVPVMLPEVQEALAILVEE